MMNLYILDDKHNPVKVDSVIKWGRSFESGKRHVALHMMNRNTIRVSTVFLGIDHQFGTNGPPVLFETMIFGGDADIDQYQRRYHTWAEAHTGHRQTVLMVRAWMKRKGIRIRNPKQLLKP